MRSPGSGVYAVYNGASYDQDCRFNYWGVNATAQMNAGVNPKNIGVIYDKYDYSSRGSSTTPDGCSDPEAHQRHMAILAWCYLLML